MSARFLGRPRGIAVVRLRCSAPCTATLTLRRGAGVLARRVVHVAGPRGMTLHLKTTIRSPRRHAQLFIRAVTADGRAAAMPALSV